MSGHAGDNVSENKRSYAGRVLGPRAATPTSSAGKRRKLKTLNLHPQTPEKHQEPARINPYSA